MPKRILSLFRNLFRKHAIERALDQHFKPNTWFDGDHLDLVRRRVSLRA